MKNITVPLDLLRRWIEAENAFIEAEIAYRSTIFDPVERMGALDVCTARLRELFAARRPIDAITRQENPPPELTKTALDRVKAETAAIKLTEVAKVIKHQHRVRRKCR